MPITPATVRPTSVETRIKMVKAMEFIASQINDETIMDTWLSLGVADGDIKFGDLSVQPTDPEELYPYYEDDKDFANLMQLFLRLMSQAYKSGGLYCDHVVSK